jgi:PAS domain S-box-containing protein
MHGQVPVTFAIVRDITEAQAQAERVARSERKYRALMEGCPEAVLVADAESGLLIEVNEAAAALFGCSADDLVGLHQSELHPPETRDHFRQTFRDHLESGRVLVPDGTILRRDGRVVPVEIKARPMEIDGRTLVVGFFRDVTHRVDQERELREAVAAADAANAAKSLFLANMSHELRTPMNSIIGFSQLMLYDDDRPLSAAHRDYAEYVLRAGNHLLSLIKDVLDLAKIDAGQMRVSLETIRLDELLADLAMAMEGPAAEKGILLDVADCDTLCVRADRVRLLQVLHNLGSNAIKFNRPGGRVTVSIEAAPAGPFVRILVTDTGPGIAPARHAELFRPFSRLDAEGSAIEGTGIGLSIAKRLVELMDGRLEFASEPGVGSRFWVDIPLAPAGAAADGPAAAPARSGSGGAAFTVLYIEDNPGNMALMQNLLGTMPGAHLLCASTGAAGVELALAEAPDLVITDIHLPDISGFDVLARLRAADRTARLPVIALTADAMPGEVRRGTAAGFTQYMTKPIHVPELIRSIRAAVGLGE